MKKYYKVVYEIIDGNLMSCVAGGKAQVEYKINEWAKAPKWLADKGYHLCVFKTKKDMFESGFIGRYFIVEIKNKIKKLPKFCNAADIHHGIIIENDRDWPEGTVMAKQVKLIREVK